MTGQIHQRRAGLAGETWNTGRWRDWYDGGERDILLQFPPNEVGLPNRWLVQTPCVQ